MGIIMFDEKDLIIAFKEVLNHDLNPKKVSIKGNYAVIYIKRKAYRIHRILGQYYFGDLKGFDIHHIDKNPLNNLKENLLKVTPSDHISKYHNDIQKYRSNESKDKVQKIMVDKIKRHDVSLEEVKRLRNLGLTYKEISNKLNCGYNTIWRRIKEIDWSKE